MFRLIAGFVQVYYEEIPPRLFIVYISLHITDFSSMV
jgi:hypothetical protein